MLVRSAEDASEITFGIQGMEVLEGLSPDQLESFKGFARGPGRGRKLRFTEEWVAYVDDLTVRTGRVVDGRFLTDAEAEEEIRAACRKGSHCNRLLSPLRQRWRRSRPKVQTMNTAASSLAACWFSAPLSSASMQSLLVYGLS